MPAVAQSILAIPDTLLGTQFQPAPAYTPAQKLMWAILEEAVSNIHTPQAAREIGVADEARAWIRSNDTTWIFSYLNVCSALNLDPAWIRQGIARRDPADGVRRGPHGEVLPPGVYFYPKCITRPYEIVIIRRGIKQRKTFATLAEAAAFRAAGIAL